MRGRQVAMYYVPEPFADMRVGYRCTSTCSHFSCGQLAVPSIVEAVEPLVPVSWASALRILRPDTNNPRTGWHLSSQNELSSADTRVSNSGTLVLSTTLILTSNWNLRRKRQSVPFSPHLDMKGVPLHCKTQFSRVDTIIKRR